MKPTISELSYAFALTENLVHQSGRTLVSAPTLPSTTDEGKKGGGYDLKLSFPGFGLFLQFKLSECMSYASSTEFIKGAFQQEVGGKKLPVYRFYLRPLAKSRQTTLMLKLERRHHFVYYAAALFHTSEELTSYYSARSVAEQSRFFRPSVIRKMPDDKEHFVSFRDSGKPWRFSDEPVELEPADTADQLLTKAASTSAMRLTVEQVATEALAAMLDVLEDASEEGDRKLSETEKEDYKRLRSLNLPVLAKAEFVARAYFDSAFITLASDA